MGFLTRANMIRTALDNLGDPNNTKEMETSLTNRHLPLVLRRLSNIMHWPEQEVESTTTLLTGEYTVSLPSAMKKLVNVRWDDGDNSQVVSIVSPTAFDRAEWATVQGSTTGDPLKCARYGSTLAFSPIADADKTISFRFTLDITDPHNDAETCPVDGVDDIIVAMLTAAAYRQLGRHQEQVAWWQGEAERLIRGHDPDMGGVPPLMRPYTARVAAGTTEDDRCWE